MPRIVLARDYQHEQIEFPPGTPFPEGRRGGGTSSLHLRRSKIRDVTVEELDFIRQNHPQIFAACDLLPDPVVGNRTRRRLEAAQKAAAAAAQPEAVPTKAPAKKAPRKRATKSE